MNNKNTYLTIDAIYNSLAKIMKNDAQLPLDQVGSHIVGCTIAESSIDDVLKKYPLLAQIGDIGAELEYQGEAYHNEYYHRLQGLIDELGKVLLDESNYMYREEIGK